MSYEYNADHGVWVRSDEHDISYSDGQRAEDKVYDTLRRCADRSTFSEELASAITGWTSEYHFSSKRHAVLRGLDFRPGQKVLELGAGCGAITRYLAEQGLQVTSVEGTVSRARTAALRCSDLENVSIYVDNFTTFEIDQEFDWVLFIGVLEYAPRFGAKGHEFGSYLDVAKRHLSSDGKLVVAIENKLGLKYFNGCTEDHVNRAFYGTQGLYDGTSAETLSREELNALLEDNGFQNNTFLYAYPDYKLCEVLITEDGMQAEGFSCADLLLTVNSRDYTNDHVPLFSEGLTSASLEKAGILREFANSFLVVSTRSSETETSPDNQGELLAQIHNLGHRGAGVSCETKFTRSGTGIAVSKKYVVPDASRKSEYAVDDFRIVHDVSDAAYLSGELEASSILRALIRTPSPSGYWQHFLPWAERLFAHARSEVENSAEVEDYLIEGKYLDAGPFNAISTEAGIMFFDLEWQATGDIPFGWVLQRGIEQTHRKLREVAGLRKVGSRGNQKRTLLLVLEGLGLSVQRRSIKHYRKLEEKFQQNFV